MPNGATSLLDPTQVDPSQLDTPILAPEQNAPPQTQPDLGTTMQSPSPSPPVDAEDHARRVTGWDAFVTKLKDDPDMRGALFMMGAQMLQSPEVGQTGLGQFGKAAAGGLNYLTQARKQRSELGVQQQELTLKKERIAVDIPKIQAETAKLRDEIADMPEERQRAYNLQLAHIEAFAAQKESAQANKELAELKKKLADDPGYRKAELAKIKAETEKIKAESKGEKTSAAERESDKNVKAYAKVHGVTEEEARTSLLTQKSTEMLKQDAQLQAGQELYAELTDEFNDLKARGKLPKGITTRKGYIRDQMMLEDKDAKMAVRRAMTSSEEPAAKPTTAAASASAKEPAKPAAAGPKSVRKSYKGQAGWYDPDKKLFYPDK